MALESDTGLKIMLNKPPSDVKQSDMHDLVPALLPTSSSQPLALAVLAKWLQSAQLNGAVVSLLKGAITSYLTSSNPAPGYAALSAALQVAPKTGCHLLGHDAVSSAIRDACKSLNQSKGKERETEASIALADLLSHVAGQAELRSDWTRDSATWLKARLEPVGGQLSEPSTSTWASALAGLAVVKFKLAPVDPNTSDSGQNDLASVSLETLAKQFVNNFIASSQTLNSSGQRAIDGARLASLEALAYLTLAPVLSTKPIIVKPAFLKVFLATGNVESSSRASDFAVATLLHHLTAFPGPDPATDERARLKATASGQKPVPRESDAQVTERIKLIVSFGPMALLKRLCVSPALSTRRLAGRVLLSLVTPRETRGVLLQGGAARFAMSLVRHSPSPYEPAQDTPAIQALAKLLITTNPMLVIGPTPDAPLVAEAVSDLLMPLAVSDSDLGDLALLVKFECLMALTNIASFNPVIVTETKPAKDVSKSLTFAPDGVMRIIQDLMMSSHTMVRRAATELACNVASSPRALTFYGHSEQDLSSSDSAAVTPDPPTDAKVADQPLNGHLHLLVALCQSEDPSTQIAASGALSALASDSSAIASALARSVKALDVLLDLARTEDGSNASEGAAAGPLGAEDALGLRHRALDVLRSVVEHTSAGSSKERDGRGGAHGLLQAGRVRQVLKDRLEVESAEPLKELISETLERMQI